MTVSLLTLGRELSELEPVLHDVSQSQATSAAASGIAPKTQDLLLKLEKCKCIWWGWEEVLRTYSYGKTERAVRGPLAGNVVNLKVGANEENGMIFQKPGVSIVQR